MARSRDKEVGSVEQLLNPTQLNLLLVVAREKSVSAAATALGVSQPFVSQQIRLLEKFAGRTLFRRTGRGMQLTSEGEAVIVYARTLTKLTAALREQLEQGSGSRKISIGMPEDFCRTSLPIVLGLFMRDHPRVEIRIVSGTYKTLIEAIETREVDFAVMRKNAHFPAATLLWTDKLVWNGRADVRVLPVGPVPLVLPLAPSPARDVIIETLQQANRSWVIRFESVGLAGIEAALQAGIGFCAGPRRMRLFGVGALPGSLGLPPLPDVDFVLVGPTRAVDSTLTAFIEIVQQAAKLSFQATDSPLSSS